MSNKIFKYSSMRSFTYMQFFYRVANSCFFCLFPMYLLNKGVNLLELSILGTVFSLGIVVFEIPTGIIADKVSRRLCIRTSYALMAIAYVIIYVYQEFYILIISQLIMAISATFSSGVIDAWLYDNLEIEGFDGKLELIASKILIIDNIGIMVGLFIGGLLSLLKIEYSFMFGIIFILVSLILSFTIMKDKKVLEVHKKTNTKFIDVHNIKKYISVKFLLLSFTMSFVAFAIQSPLNQHWQPYFNQLGLDNEFLLSNIYNFRSILVIIGGFIAGKIAISTTRERLSIFRFMISISAICLFITSESNSIIISLVFWSLISLFNSIARTFWVGKLIHSIPKDKRSTLLSLNSLIFSMGSMLGGVVCGYIAQYQSIQNAWKFGVILFIVAILFSKLINTIESKEKSIDIL